MTEREKELYKQGYQRAYLDRMLEEKVQNDIVLKTEAGFLFGVMVLLYFNLDIFNAICIMLAMVVVVVDYYMNNKIIKILKKENE